MICIRLLGSAIRLFKMDKCCLSYNIFLNSVLQIYKMYFTKSQDALNCFSLIYFFLNASSIFLMASFLADSPEKVSQIQEKNLYLADFLEFELH